jgi:hypothetical protein
LEEEPEEEGEELEPCSWLTAAALVPKKPSAKQRKTTPDELIREMEERRAKANDSERRLRETIDQVCPTLDLDRLKKIRTTIRSAGMDWIDRAAQVLKLIEQIDNTYITETIPASLKWHGEGTYCRNKRDKRGFRRRCLREAFGVGFWWGEMYYNEQLLEAVRKLTKFPGPF